MFIKVNLKFLQIITPCIKGRGWFMGAGAGAEHQEAVYFLSEISLWFAHWLRTILYSDY
jgi:hypothetical protein